MSLRDQFAARARARAEVRAGDAGGYTDRIIDAVEMAAAAPVANAAATAAAETAAGMIGRALMLAHVDAPAWALPAITPEWLLRVAYDLVTTTSGHLSVIEVNGGRLVLDVASTWTWYGTRRDRSDWRVLAQLPRPTGDETRNVAEAATVAVGWAPARFTPWYGRGPLARSKLTAELSARIDDKLGQEASGQVGHLVVIPRARSKDGTETFDGRLATLDELAGKTASLPALGGYDPAGPAGSSHMSLRPMRIGANPPDPLVKLQENVFAQVLAACGVPPGLVGQSNGSQAREDYRRFALTTVEPIATAVAAELTAKLDAPVTLTLDRLAHADIAGRARAARTLVDAGWSAQEAATAVGLPAPAAKPDPEPTPEPADD